ncbi:MULTISPECIES: flagellar hook assembly protein FlgD [unclassified Pseudomonas]|uniref:flagellar hook assembly protein FlgD n=1 Tax=unclassified Pseudomonas TaxID=196821 RepID=UPI0035C01EC8
MAIDNSTLNDVLRNSGVSDGTSKPQTQAQPTDRNALDRNAFLNLLVTQMQHQNPLDPQDNGEFVSQLAQFSSLEGITNLNNSVTGISDALGSSQALQASSLVGRSVIVQNDKAMVDTTKSFNGQVVVPQTISEGKVTIKDKDGNVVRTLDLGEQKAGNADFIWDGKNDKGEVAPAGEYSFTATTTVDGKSVEMYTLLPATVTSVTFGAKGSEMMLNLAGIGKVGISKVQTIGI